MRSVVVPREAAGGTDLPLWSNGSCFDTPFQNPFLSAETSAGLTGTQAPRRPNAFAFILYEGSCHIRFCSKFLAI